jgi:TrmH family RNA methyltransferase
MKSISSSANPLYRELLESFRHAGRAGHQAWLEGPHLCQVWLQAHGEPDWMIFSSACAHDDELTRIRAQVPVDRQIELSAPLFDRLSSVKSPQGVTFVVDIPRAQFEPNPLVCTVLLDEVQDPGNVGTILRLCAAAGISQIVCSAGTAACWSPKVLRSGQGAQFGLSMTESVDALQWLRRYQQHSLRAPVIVTALEGAQSLYAHALPEAVLWVFGHEGRGVRPDIQALADRRVHIDQDRSVVESLNVASAAAICLFEQRRQHPLSKAAPPG